jgi:hypothetical protein
MARKRPPPSCVWICCGDRACTKNFVSFSFGGDRLSILVSTDLTLDATEIIELYGYRFKIECTFREMKQVIGAFGYRFWSASMPKLNRYRRRGETDPLEQVTNGSDRKRIRLTLQAIEGFVMCSVIATGIVQLLALHFSGRTPARFIRYLRTPSKSIVSEATVVAHLRQSIFRLFAQNPHLSVTQTLSPRLCLGELNRKCREV